MADEKIQDQLPDAAALYALRLLDKGFSVAALASHANVSVTTMRRELKRAEKLQAQT